MATGLWLITDTAQATHQANCQISSEDLGIKGASVKVSTLQGGLSDGVQVITVTTDRLSVSLLPTRGMGIWKATCDGMPFGWKSPIRGPVHPAHVPLREPSGLGWLEGFDELLVRCGLESNGFPEFEENGALRHPLHGRIGNLPANSVAIEANAETGKITVIGEVFECRFHFLKLKLISRTTVEMGSTKIDIHDTVENLSASDAECQMLYHANFGRPLLEEGATVHAPFKTLMPLNAHTAEAVEDWQTYPAPQPGFKEHVFILRLLAGEDGYSTVLLQNAAGSTGVALRCQVTQLPAFTLWKNPIADEDGYVTGLEPGTNYPNPRSYEGKQGRVATIPGKGSTDFELSLDLLVDRDAISRVRDEIAALQDSGSGKIYPNPQPGWCADAG